MKMNKNSPLKQAIESIRAGDKLTGQKLLLSILKEDPNNESALLWLSATTNDPAKKRQCFEQVLRINPTNESATQGLLKLDAAAPPESPTSPAEPKSQKKKINLLLIILAIILLFCCVIPIGRSILNYTSQKIGLFPTTTATRNLTPTRPFIRNATSLPAPTPTPTKTPTRNPDLAKAGWGEVDIRALMKNPDKYLGHEVHYKGEVFAIEESNEGSTMQVWVEVPGGNEFDREAVVIFFDGNTDPIYTGTKVEFWGYCTGAAEGENAFGGVVRQPLILVEYLTYFSSGQK